METKTPLFEFRRQLRDAKAIAEDMLTQPIEPEIVVSYTRSILEGWDRLNRLEAVVGEIQAEVLKIEGQLAISGHFQMDDLVEGVPAKGEKGVRDSRPLRIEITEGMIKQNLLTFTEGVKRGLLKVGEELRIRLPNDDLLVSTLLPTGNRLQERGRIRRLYQENNVRAGDFAILRRADSGEWTLQFEAGRKLGDPLSL